jgi:hypothetical protein
VGSPGVRGARGPARVAEAGGLDVLERDANVVVRAGGERRRLIFVVVINVNADKLGADVCLAVADERERERERRRES